MWSALSLPHLQDPKTAAMMSILKVPASPSPARFLNLSFVAGAWATTGAAWRTGADAATGAGVLSVRSETSERTSAAATGSG